MPAQAPRPSAYTWFLALTCVALAALVWGLVQRNEQLNARIEALTGRVLAAEAQSLRSLEGAEFPVPTLFESDGTPVVLSAIPESHGTLLFVSSPACEYCELAAPVWDRVARRLGGTPLRALGLVLDAGSGVEPEPAKTARAIYPELRSGGADAELSSWLPGVPAALLLDAHGRILHAEFGGEQRGLEAAVEAFLATAD